MLDIIVKNLDITNYHEKGVNEEIPEKGTLLVCPLCKDIFKSPFPLPMAIRCKCGYSGKAGRPVLK